MTRRKPTDVARRKSTDVARVPASLTSYVRPRSEAVLRKAYLIMNGPHTYLGGYRINRFGPGYEPNLQPEWVAASGSVLHPLVLFDPEMARQMAFEIADADNDVRVEMIRI